MALGYGRTGTNNFATAKFIVDTNGLAAGATHSTIASALTSAVSGETIFIKPGTYTEDLTLKAGVTLTCFNADGRSPTVTIVGKMTAGYSGTASISGIRLETNTDFAIVVSGSNATLLYLVNCFIYASDNMAISYTTTGASKLWGHYCLGDIGTTGISYIAMSGACTGTVKFFHSFFENNGASTTVSTNASSAGAGLSFEYCYFGTGVTTSNSAIFEFLFSETSSGSDCPIIIGGTGASAIHDSFIGSGTASAISVSASCTLNLTNSRLTSSNTNPVTGAGTVNYSSVVYSGTGDINNVTTQTGQYVELGKYMARHQPCFLAVASLQSNVTGDSTAYDILFATEIFDQGSNFASPSFTAPETGRYLICGSLNLGGLTSATTDQINLDIITSNRNYRVEGLYNGGAALSLTNFNSAGSVIADMDALDTALLRCSAYGTTKIADVGATGTTFSATRIA